ncbi:MAG: aspartate-semialdehyde dehydrogenase, partial [Candidatus Eremiobacteraeota bacterium]|nr:aspartate-semialdehyde dehydrogenase [Candidatus Eremiobacteraeota bacterium]
MKIAVVGATGLVGEALLRVLEERQIRVSSISAFARRARNGAATFEGKPLDVQPTDAESLKGFDAIFFAGGDEPSAEIVPKLSG